jgi:hypothetical protein
MRKPSYRSFDLDIKLDIISTPSDLADQTEVMVMELANFFGLDSAALLVKNESGVVTRRYHVNISSKLLSLSLWSKLLNGHFLLFPPILYTIDQTSTAVSLSLSSVTFSLCLLALLVVYRRISHASRKLARIPQILARKSKKTGQAFSAAVRSGVSCLVSALTRFSAFFRSVQWHVPWSLCSQSPLQLEFIAGRVIRVFLELLMSFIYLICQLNLYRTHWIFGKHGSRRYRGCRIYRQQRGVAEAAGPFWDSCAYLLRSFDAVQACFDIEMTPAAGAVSIGRANTAGCQGHRRARFWRQRWCFGRTRRFFEGPRPGFCAPEGIWAELWYGLGTSSHVAELKHVRALTKPDSRYGLYAMENEHKRKKVFALRQGVVQGSDWWLGLHAVHCEYDDWYCWQPWASGLRLQGRV